MRRFFAAPENIAGTEITLDAEETHHLRDVLRLGVGDAANVFDGAGRELERARLLQEDTLCWDSMPAATREWMRANRAPLAEYWNVLTRLRAEDVHNAA